MENLAKISPKNTKTHQIYTGIFFLKKLKTPKVSVKTTDFVGKEIIDDLV
jgi:predicted NUDIX family phosphoesterase